MCDIESLKECCDDYVSQSKPKNKKEGKFWEDSVCPKCGKKLNIQFKGQKVYGGNIACEAIGAEYLKK